MIIEWITNRIKGEKKKEKVKIEIEELKKALLNDPEFRDEILRELEYRTGRRDILKAGVLGLLGLAVGGAAGAATVGNEMATETISDYTCTKIPKPCTCIVAQDGTGDYDVLPNEDASVIIQRAIDNVAKRGGGEVRIKEGKYEVHTSLKIQKSYLALKGMGWGTKLVGVNTDNVIFIDGINNYTQGVVIKGLHISGSGNGIHIVGEAPRVVTKSEIKNCYIEKVDGHGIAIGGVVYRTAIRDTTVHKVGGYGMYFHKYAADTPCINYFNNIEIITTNDAIRGVLRVSKLDSISTNNKIFIEAGYGNLLIDCHVEECPNIGIQVNQSNHRLISCKVVNAGGDAFYINSKFTTLLGCFTFGTIGGYDLKSSGYSDGLTIKGCNFSSYSINPKIIDPDIDFLNNFENQIPIDGVLSIKFQCRFSKKPKIEITTESPTIWYVSSWITDTEGYYIGCNIKFVDASNRPTNPKCHVYISKS